MWTWCFSFSFFLARLSRSRCFCIALLSVGVWARWGFPTALVPAFPEYFVGVNEGVFSLTNFCFSIFFFCSIRCCQLYRRFTWSLFIELFLSKLRLFPAWGNDGLPRVVVYDVNDAIATNKNVKSKRQRWVFVYQSSPSFTVNQSSSLIIDDAIKMQKRRRTKEEEKMWCDVSVMWWMIRRRGGEPTHADIILLLMRWLIIMYSVIYYYFPLSLHSFTHPIIPLSINITDNECMMITNKKSANTI